MELELLFRYLHFIGIIMVAGMLCTQRIIIKPRMSGISLRTIARVDAMYGLGSVLFVGAGLCLWLWVGKPAEYYTYNWIFILKLSLAVILGILSLWPTRFFWKFRKSSDSNEYDVPGFVLIIINIELILLAIIPLCAVLMARGYGYEG